MDFTMTEQINNNVASIVMKGRLDAAVAASVKDQLRKLGESGHPNVAVGMSEVTFVDSSGLGALVASLRTLQGMGGDLIIGGVSDKVRMVLELIKLHKVFDIYPDVETALRAFSKE